MLTHPLPDRTPTEAVGILRHLVMASLMLLALGGCVVTGSYPKDWAEPAKKELVGKCPSIAGRFHNSGIGHPTEAGPLLLTRLFDLPDGEQVEITQSPDVIEVAVWTGGSRTAAVTFTNVWLDPWADTIQPRTFQCPIDIPSGRVLLFSDLSSNSFGGAGGIAAVGSRNTFFSTAADGSLIVTRTNSSAIIVGFVPVGRVDREYYRFERVAP